MDFFSRREFLESGLLIETPIRTRSRKTALLKRGVKMKITYIFLLGLLFLFSCQDQAESITLKLDDLNRSNIYYLDKEYGFSGETSSTVKEVMISYEGEELERVTPVNNVFQFKKKFERLNPEGELVLSGLDKEGQELVESKYDIRIVKRVSDSGNLFDFTLPNPTSNELRSRQSLWATNYYLPQVTSVEGGYALRDMRGRPLGPTLARRDWCDSAMEGSVLVLDGNGEGITYNYAGTSSSYRVDCSMYWSYNSSTTKFKKARGKYGDGVKGYKLVPFRTIAVDRRRFAYGTIIYIPAAVGNELVLPDGSKAVHDGYFFAGDTGSAIKTNHIDVYIGVAEKKPFAWVRSSSKRTFKAHVVNNPSIKKYLTDLHLD
jgi:3D (Asp-Asp-Asp) domain-containing protein